MYIIVYLSGYVSVVSRQMIYLKRRYKSTK